MYILITPGSRMVNVPLMIDNQPSVSFACCDENFHLHDTSTNYMSVHMVNFTP